MTTSTRQRNIRETSNVLPCDPPAVFVRNGGESWQPYEPRYHRSTPDNFPRLELVPHPTCELLNIEVLVTYHAADASGCERLEAMACGVRMKHGHRARLCRVSVVTSLGDELYAEKRALLNQ